jgi:hypothetical protein
VSVRPVRNGSMGCWGSRLGRTATSFRIAETAGVQIRPCLSL